MVETWPNQRQSQEWHGYIFLDHISFFSFMLLCNFRILKKGIKSVEMILVVEPPHAETASQSCN